MHRIMLSSEPFNVTKSREIKAGGEDTVLSIELSHGKVAFLYYIGVTKIQGVEWKWTIDGEEVNEYIGTVTNPAYYKPPFLIKKGLTLTAKNNTDRDVLLHALCAGLICEEATISPQEPQVVIQPDTNNQEVIALLKEIKEQLAEKTPVGFSFDKKIEVTDKIKMLYNDKNKGLNWTACDIYNYGPDPVYYAINEWRRPEVPLYKDQWVNVDFGKRNAIKRIYFVCDSGQKATVYIRVLK